MLKLHLGKIEFEECRNCGGFWLSHSIIEELCKLSKLPENLLLRYPSDKLPKTKPTGQRSCSQCNDSVLVSIHSLEVPTEICKTCKGLWLEHGQLKKILKAQKSESVQATSQPWSCAQCQSLNMSTRDQCSKCQGACPSGI